MGTFLLWLLFSTGHFSPLAAFLHWALLSSGRFSPLRGDESFPNSDTWPRASVTRAGRAGEDCRLHYEGDCNDAATGSQDTTLLCRGGQPVDNSTRRVLLDLVHTNALSDTLPSADGWAADPTQPQALPASNKKISSKFGG